ncbi:hypothetical protein A2U01_0029405, partial [Trifolium medium]|nr:hypothetical protein [Trifolium medium]
QRWVAHWGFRDVFLVITIVPFGPRGQLPVQLVYCSNKGFGLVQGKDGETCVPTDSATDLTWIRDDLAGGATLAGGAPLPFQ